MVLMKNCSPVGYICPICLGNNGIESDDTLLKQNDLVFKDELVSVWINSFWIGENKGHLIVVPNQHFVTLWDLPNEVGHRIFEVSKLMAMALKEVYQCDGVTLRQNNEPAGDQHAFHYHQHIFPRYLNDDFNQKMTEKSTLSDPQDRIIYVKKLRKYLKENTDIKI